MSDDDRDDVRKEGAAGATARAEEGSGRTGPLQFLKEVRGELRKVAWPNRKELTSYTIVVLVVSLILTIMVWGFDQVIRNAVINTLG